MQYVFGGRGGRCGTRMVQKGRGNSSSRTFERRWLLIKNLYERYIANKINRKKKKVQEKEEEEDRGDRDGCSRFRYESIC
jgi:hypothetical protein